MKEVSNKKKQEVKRYITLFLGLFIYASTYNLFMLSNNIVAGGVSGIAIITQDLINPALLIFLSTCVLFFLSYFLLGKTQTKASFIGAISYPFFVWLTSNIGNVIKIEHHDLLLISIFAGLLGGFSTGLILKNGFTTGGTDILNQIVSKYFNISIGSAILINDGLIVLAGGIVFGWTKVMYAIIVIYILSMIADKVILGISSNKAFYIVTSKDEEVKKYIIGKLGYGVTILESKGGYTGVRQNVLMCVLPTRDYFKLKEGIKTIDKEAFFVITDSYEVLGGA